MNLSALLTSAGINVGLCALMLMLYSFLRKQPGNASVYFARRLAEEHIQRRDGFSFKRLVPSPRWILKAWEYSEEEILSFAGLDAVVFLRILVFSIRIFSIAAVVCILGVLPVNYYGQEMHHIDIPSESLDAFTIGNVMQGSRWLWVHCLALYIITLSACVLLYFEYKSIAIMRLVHITRSPPSPSHFSVLVRAIPKTADESFSDSVRNFFTNYYASSYLSHQMICKGGKVQKIMNTTGTVYKKFIHLKASAIYKKCRPIRYRCGLCGGTPNSFQLYRTEYELSTKKNDLSQSDSHRKEKECSASFVFFKTRYAAVVASEVLQSSNPMLWVTNLAPEPHDVYWSNLWIPYRQLWFRRIATLLASIVFMFLFLVPVTFVQGLSHLDQIQRKLPFLKGLLNKPYVNQLVTGYLPSVILMLFLYIVSPLMMLLSAVEGPISHNGRKKSACFKILCFTIWNVFFVTVLSGSYISLTVISSPKQIPNQLAKAVPGQATFFITYVLTSGWASLSSELMQLFSLIWNYIKRHVCKIKVNKDYVPSFPYHTEVPRVLFFGLLGFTFSILAPLMLPFLLVYFFLGYVVFRNQFHNVYSSKYDTRGQMWPIMHNTTVFSLVLAQIIALGVFGIKNSPVAAGFIIPLLMSTLLFNEYCRQRFHPVFKQFPAKEIIEMDREDEQGGRMEEIHQQVLSAYRQFPLDAPDECGGQGESSDKFELKDSLSVVDGSSVHPALVELPFSKPQANDTNAGSVHPAVIELPVSKPQDNNTDSGSMHPAVIELPVSKPQDNDTNGGSVHPAVIELPVSKPQEDASSHTVLVIDNDRNTSL